MKLHTLQPNPGASRDFRRVARGNGSGRGTTAGRGTKGQQSRTGKGQRPGFEGGQTPLIRRQPKLGGFINHNRIDYEVINLDLLEKKLDAGSYDVAALVSFRLVSGKQPVKLLARGAIKKKLELTVNAASKSAKEAVAKAGGSVRTVKN